jgi:NADH dehydrogenase [ubiquinone] 1 alpha subcomplex assembly factor 1
MNPTAQINGSTKTLFDFSDPAALSDWHAIDDVVMGGCSNSHMRWSEQGYAVFEGEVSLENNGGFASVRSRAGHYHLDGYDGITLSVRGDGRRYGLNLRLATLLPVLRFEAKFPTTPGRWETVVIPFGQFGAKIYGSRVPGTPRLNPRWIRSFGLIISDKQQGLFRLEVASIGSFRRE